VPERREGGGIEEIGARCARRLHALGGR
jgi:hypothetical protein